MNAKFKLFATTGLVASMFVIATVKSADHPDKPDIPAKPSGNPNYTPPLIEGRADISNQAAGTAEFSARVQHGGYASTPNPGCIGSTQDDAKATCVVVGVSGIPIGSEIVSVRVYARNYTDGAPADWSECAAGKECSVGWAKFVGSYYRATTSQTQQSVRWPFKNWNDAKDRDVRMVVTFK
jgi:hypothetical protein